MVAFSDVISVVALITSLIAVTFSGWQLLQNRARLRVRATENFIEEEHPEREWLLVELINFGAHPTTVTQVVLVTWGSVLDGWFRRRSTAKEKHLLFRSAKERPEHPLLLQPGRMQSLTFRAEAELKEALGNRVKRLAILHSWDARWKFVPIAKRTAYIQ